MYLAEDPRTWLDMGGSDYALKKLLRWRAEGPTERNKQMVRFILEHGNLSARWRNTLPQTALLLIDLALEWNDLAMWQEVVRKSIGNGDTSSLSSDILFRVWSAFSFDRTKDMFVHFILVFVLHPFAYVSHRWMDFAESRKPFSSSLAR